MNRHRRVSPQRTQSGAALAAALFFLVALTLIGVAAVSSNVGQSRQSATLAESHRSFQSAESAMLAAENWLQRLTLEPTYCDPLPAPADCPAAAVWPVMNVKGAPSTPPCTLPAVLDAATGTCVVNVDAFTFNWQANGRRYDQNYDTTFPVPVATPLANRNLPNTAQVPRYAIEVLGPDLTGSLVMGQGRTYKPVFFRVTATGTGAQGDTQSLVQSVYVKGF